MFWGTTYVIATELLPANRPLLAAAVRALPIGLAIVLGYRVFPTGVWWRRSFVLGALNIGLFSALLLTAAFRLSGGVVATVGAMQPLLVILLSWLVFGQRPLPPVVLFAGLGIAGVGLLVLDPAAHLDALGVAAAIGASFAMASGVVLTKHWGRPVPLLVFTGWQLTTGGLILAPLALFIEETPPALTSTNVFGFAWLAIVNTGLGYALWFWGIEKMKAWQVSFLGLLSPVVAVVAGFVILDQTFSPVQAAGVVLILFSLVVVQRLGTRSSSTRASTAIAPGENNR